MRHFLLPWRWHKKKYYGAKIPVGLSDWLFDTGSLTQRIRNYCQHDFRVRVIAQNWQQPRLDELQALGLPLRETAVVREVELLCGNKAWVFARSVFPKKTLIGKGVALHALDAKPLIEILSRDFQLIRSDFEITTLSLKQLYLPGIKPDVAATNKMLWARRSIFHFYGKPLLVTEVFLPAVIE